MKRARKARRRRLQFESLERRDMMVGGITASLNLAGVLSVTGTDANDSVCFRQSSSILSINGISGSWTASNVKAILVDAGRGDDFVSLNSMANGGNQSLKQKVTVLSGDGATHVTLNGGRQITLFGTPQRLEVSAAKAPLLNGTALNLTNNIVTSLKSGVLTIKGTNGNDQIAFKQSRGKISINGVSGTWAVSKLKSIVVELQAGEDAVSLASLDNGGAQPIGVPITIRSGNGTGTVHLADGHDVTLAGADHTLQIAVNGTASLDGQILTWEDPNPPPPDPPPPDPNPTPDPDPPPNPDPPPHPANWFDANIQDAALRSLGSDLYVDGSIDRSDALALFREVELDGGVTAMELADLQLVASTSSLFGGLDYVQRLSGYTVNGYSITSAKTGTITTIVGLSAGASGATLEQRVGKWFFGTDHPAAGGTYLPFAGSLFVSGPSYTDIRQGNLGDCYYMAGLAEIALKDPSIITSMFIVNGDGTYTVRFYNGGQKEYVTVDSYLPTSGGATIYASPGMGYLNSGNELWVALAEKAYAQVVEMGWSRGIGQPNAYSSLEYGLVMATLSQVTGQSVTDISIAYNPSLAFTSFVAAYNNGKMIGFASKTGTSDGVVPSHAYAVVAYDSATQTVTLFNPWGINYGQLTLNWTQITANFDWFDQTV